MTEKTQELRQWRELSILIRLSDHGCADLEIQVYQDSSADNFH